MILKPRSVGWYHLTPTFTDGHVVLKPRSVAWYHLTLTFTGELVILQPQRSVGWYHLALTFTGERAETEEDFLLRKEMQETHIAQGDTIQKGTGLHQGARWVSYNFQTICMCDLENTKFICSRAEVRSRPIAIEHINWRFHCKNSHIQCNI